MFKADLFQSTTRMASKQNTSRAKQRISAAHLVLFSFNSVVVITIIPLFEIITKLQKYI
jgi:hypothetical protein